jgi:hypothetical protein
VTLTARWGEQLDVRHITEAGDAQELSAEQVAGYVAKYATKATEALGITLDHRIGEVELEDLDLPAHVVELIRACLELASRPGLVGLRLGKWAHMLGFGGNTVPLDAWGRPEDDQAIVVVASWSYLGQGYQTTGEACWPPRRPPGPGKRDGSPRRNYAP